MSTRLLGERPVLHADVGGTNIVVVTSVGGARRAYASAPYRVATTDGNDTVRDDSGGEWVAEEDFLVAKFDSSVRLARVAGHRAFWFGWYAQHPDTVLVD
jgi:hypothetical protein